MSDLYIWDDRKRIRQVDDVVEWASWYETANRVVAEESVGELQVSTVFLGLAHVSPNLSDPEPGPYLFETMVFGPPWMVETLAKIAQEDITSILAKFAGCFDVQKRYRTLDEAIAGHKAMMEFVKEALPKLPQQN